MGEKVEWIWWGKIREITGCRVENELCSGRPEPQHRHLLAMTQLRGPFIQALGLEDLPRAAPTFLEVAHAPLGHDADPLGNISSFPLHTSIIEILWAQPARKVNPTIQRARSLKTHHAKKKKKNLCVQNAKWERRMALQAQEECALFLINVKVLIKSSLPEAQTCSMRLGCVWGWCWTSLPWTPREEPRAHLQKDKPMLTSASSSPPCGPSIYWRQLQVRYPPWAS